jgi:hypothetical protein
MVSLFLAQNQIYPVVAEAIVLVAGLIFAAYLTYTYHKITSSTSEQLFGVLNRHFKSLNRVFIVLGASQMLYFVLRLVSMFNSVYEGVLIYFDLLALIMLIAAFFLGQPLLKNLQTLPTVYEVDEF